MDRHEMEEKIRSAVAQATPDQLEDILAACEGDVGAPMPLPKATRRRPALAALAAVALVALGLGLFPTGGLTGSSLGQGAGPVRPMRSVSATTPRPTQTPKTTQPAGTAPAVTTPTASTPNAIPTPTEIINVYIPDPAVTPSPSPVPAYSSYVGPSAALHAALLALDLSYDELPYHTEELDWYNGAAVYDVDICHNGVEYDCKVDAYTGSCLHWEQDTCDHLEHREGHHSDHHTQPNTSGLLDQDVALARACASVSLSTADVLDLKAELDWEDDQLVYEVEFCHGGTEYDCQVNAYTGACQTKQELCDHAEHQTTSTAYLDQVTALYHACAHLSLSTADVLDAKAELDQEDGLAVYEVEFCHNCTRYELELDACTGQVLKQDWEPCDRTGHGHDQGCGYGYGQGHNGHHGGRH